MKLPVASHSFLSAWDNCPWKAYRQYIAKDLPRQPQTEAMKWGNEVHTAFEVRLKHGTPFPKGMEKYEIIARPFVNMEAESEKMVGIKADGTECDFFAKDVWLRGKIDTTVVKNDWAMIADWKTGKRREERAELEVHGVLLKAWIPSVTKITAHYVWLQEMQIGKAHDVSDTEKTLADIRSTMNTVANCLEIENFPKRRNPLCGYCPVMDCENNTVRK